MKLVILIGIGIGIVTIGVLLITINNFPFQRKTDYFILLKSQLNYLGNHVQLDSIRVCCLVLTTPRYLLTRARAVNATWGSRCDRLFFITEYPQLNKTFRRKQFLTQLPIAPIDNIKSGYDHLTQKITLAFLFVYKNYYNDFDWFVKADDDTYLIVENLKIFLSEQDPSKPVTFGYNYKVIVPKGYHSGGASYVLSRESLRRFYEGHQDPNNTYCRKDGGVEDVDIALCLRGRGVYIGKSLDKQNRELFHPLRFSDHFLGSFPNWLTDYAENPLQTHYNCCSDQSISFHYITPEEQHYLDFLLYRVRSIKNVEKFNNKI